ncbi:MAG: ATP-binding protein [bacterium]|nr:ATP-binding protein [bacterium]MDZ4284944.1 ATP-binding protein [Patescibacteria group bacterium]
MESLSTELLLGALAFSTAGLLGLVVFLRDRKSATHQLFFVLAVLIEAYIVVNFVSLHPPRTTPESQLFWIRMVMFVVSYIGPTLLLLVTTFPAKRIRLSWRLLVPVGMLMVASAAASLLPFVFSSIHYPEGEPIPIPGPGIFVFAADFVGLFILSFVVLLVRYRRAVGPERSMLNYLFWGVVVSFSLMAIFAFLFVVVIKTSAFVFLGPIFPVILMASIAYAIVRHRMFNIRLIATEALVVSILIFLFVRLFTRLSTTDIVIDATIFVLSAVFGVLVIRGVHREAAARERIQKLADDLRAANVRLQELDQLKSEFLSLASHQIRTPISVIKGYASLLLEGSIGPLTEQVHEAVDRIFRSGNALALIVDDFLNISRIEQGQLKYDFVEIDLSALLSRLVEEQRSVSEKIGLTLDLHMQTGEPVTIQGDEGKIRQVVANLIDNAIKYTPHGGITVTLGGHAEEGCVHLSVSDTGIGIAKETIPTLFTKFGRAKNASAHNVSGTGLGLYLARQIVQAHGGKIWAESEGEGKGTTLHLELRKRLLS